ncbi:glycosyltransferase family 32 protein [Schizothecium vesticola]|uniref:Glycosyltransferase family 32 protein n=1 Tax=Schizothecium vesticola TaxID=314040 RepID=A0AA40BR26_9PEZI|nr:glycosyltransferase family 32 protein [Schizothecium vesticola]
MGVIHLPARHRSHRWLVACLIGLVVIGAWLGRALLFESWTLASLPAFWWSGSDRFLLSAAGSDFDVSFANYSTTQTSAAPFDDRVPPILHHVAMGGAGAARQIEQWKEVRQSCLDIHPGWEAHIWTDEKANAFVAEQFPELREMWDGYKFPIQRIDALRYMVLYHYGGVILDMDLQCRRALGPLRRFDFVAPAAHPTGFSVGFMMASQRNPFVGALVRNLRPYNRAWLGLPYPTVMFSTGCHYASTIHAYQPNRTTLKVLAGPPDNFRLHSLNGHVQTPIFNHLGSSSWHSYDAALIVSVGRMLGHKLPILAVVAGVVVFVVVRRTKRRRAVRV